MWWLQDNRLIQSSYIWQSVFKLESSYIKTFTAHKLLEDTHEVSIAKIQDKSVSSCETVRTSLWRRPNAPHCPTNKHWRRPDVRATPSEPSVNKYSTRSLFSEIDTVWEVSAIRPDDSATHPDDVQYLQTVRTTWQHVQMISSKSNNSRFPFKCGKDFKKDRLDARSSCPNANLIQIELRCFWRISQKFVRTRLSSVRMLYRQSLNLSSFWSLLKPINRGL